MHLPGWLCYRMLFCFQQILGYISKRWRGSPCHTPNAKAPNEHEATNRTVNDPETSVPYETLRYLASGKSSVVYAIDKGRVLKEFHDDDGRSDVELRAYHRLGTHPNIAEFLGVGNNNSLILEYGQTLRTICRASPNEVSIQTKLAWLKQAATGYQHVHDCRIVHGDVGTRNMIVTPNGCLKLIDFEGSGVNGEPADSCYEWFSYRPSMPSVTRQTDIFAFGCAMYELETGMPPYHELEKYEDAGRLVEQRYSANDFPIVEHLLLGNLILCCWHGRISTMGQLVRELEALNHSA